MTSANKMNRSDLRRALRHSRVLEVEVQSLRCCGYGAWVIEHSGRRSAFVDDQGQALWRDQAGLKQALRHCGVREVYWRQPVSHDEMIGRPQVMGAIPGLRMPLGD